MSFCFLHVILSFRRSGLGFSAATSAFGHKTLGRYALEIALQVTRQGKRMLLRMTLYALANRPAKHPERTRPLTGGLKLRVVRVRDGLCGFWDLRGLGVVSRLPGLGKPSGQEYFSIYGSVSWAEGKTYNPPKSFIFTFAPAATRNQAAAATILTWQRPSTSGSLRPVTALCQPTDKTRNIISISRPSNRASSASAGPCTTLSRPRNTASPASAGHRPRWTSQETQHHQHQPAPKPSIISISRPLHRTEQAKKQSITSISRPFPALDKPRNTNRASPASAGPCTTLSRPRNTASPASADHSPRWTSQEKQHHQHQPALKPSIISISRPLHHTEQAKKHSITSISRPFPALDKPRKTASSASAGPQTKHHQHQPAPAPH